MVSVAALDEAFQGKTTNTKGLVDLLGKKFHGDGNGSDSKIISFCELLINHKPPFVGMFDVEEISAKPGSFELFRAEVGHLIAGDVLREQDVSPKANELFKKNSVNLL